MGKSKPNRKVKEEICKECDIKCGFYLNERTHSFDARESYKSIQAAHPDMPLYQYCKHYGPKTPERKSY